MVAGEVELAERMHYFLRHPEEAAERGEAGLQALKSKRGLTQKAAEMIAEIIRN